MAENSTNRTRRRKKRIKKRNQLIIRVCARILLLGILIAVGILTMHVIRNHQIIQNVEGKIITEQTKIVTDGPPFDVQLLPINEYSRPGLAMEQVNGIVIHYTANPGTTAQQNHDYFEGLAESGETHASSHFIIGMEGEIIQCIPCQEISYASNDRNSDTISIECCIPDDTGKFTQSTYDSLVHLTAWLMGRNGVTIAGVIRHYDVTGKNCPKYYVEHEDAWEKLKQDISNYIEVNGTAEVDTEE